MGSNIKINKGVDVKLQGRLESDEIDQLSSSTYALLPSNFHGVTPKMEVKAGDEVLAGTPLFHDKFHEQVKFCAPVSGEVVEVVRGEKRKILEVKILADKELRFKDFGASDPSNMDGEAVKNHLLASGAWPFVMQRPYDVIANPSHDPKAIFISTFSSAPLAPDLDFQIKAELEHFKVALTAMAKLTKGKVHVSVRGGSDSSYLSGISGIEVHEVYGSHPAGNVGTQIHKIDPINKGEFVWTVDVPGLLTIGRLFKTGHFDTSRLVATTGAAMSKRSYFKAYAGIELSKALEGRFDAKSGARLIGGNVLTGATTSHDSFLGFYDYQLTAIPEVEDRAFFGWIAPGLNKFSMSNTFFGWMTPNKEYNLNTSLNGEERAFVMSGQYEKVFPMDIYPVQLLKAILVEDIELMENLGIYEVAPEDFALCEVVCTSKINSQAIVRSGLDLMIQEMS